MSELSLRVNQSLVDKTFDKIGPFPYKVFSYPSSELVKNYGEDMPVSYSEMELYTEKSLSIMEQHSAQLFSDEPKDSFDTNDQLMNIVALLKHENGDKSDKSFNKQYLKALTTEDQEAIVYGSLMSANYIIENQSSFTSAEDLELVKQAIILSEQENPENFLFLSTFDKGLGGFLRRIWRRGKGLLSSVLRYSKRALKRIIKIKFELTKLEIEMLEKPSFALGNPLKVRHVNLNVSKIQVKLRYRIFGRWFSINFTFGDSVQLKSSANFALEGINNAVYVQPKFDKVSFRIRILGVRFTIGLTTVANNILADQGKLMVYDLKDIVQQMQIKNLSYSIANVDIPSSTGFLEMKIAVNVQNIS
jgi:hypothetical protein